MLRPHVIPVYCYPKASLGAPINTSTDDVTVQVGVLETNVNNLDNSIQGWYTSVPHTSAFDEFYKGWTNFKGQVTQFIHEWRTTGFSFLSEKLNPFSDAQPGPWVKPAWNYYDNAQSLISQNTQWRNKFTSISGRTPETPDLEPPGQPFLDQFRNYALFGGVALLALLWIRR